MLHSLRLTVLLLSFCSLSACIVYPEDPAPHIDPVQAMTGAIAARLATDPAHTQRVIVKFPDLAAAHSAIALQQFRASALIRTLNSPEKELSDRAYFGCLGSDSVAFACEYAALQDEATLLAKLMSAGRARKVCEYRALQLQSQADYLDTLIAAKRNNADVLKRTTRYLRDFIGAAERYHERECALTVPVTKP